MTSSLDDRRLQVAEITNKTNIVMQSIVLHEFVAIPGNLNKHCLIWAILAEILLRNYTIKSWLIFQPHLTSVSALTGKSQKHGQVSHMSEANFRH